MKSTNKKIVNLVEIQNYLSNIKVAMPVFITLHRGSLKEIQQVVPSKPGLYAIFRSNGQCFYVGSSLRSMRARLAMHYGKDKDENYRRKLGELSSPDNFRFWFYPMTQQKKMDDQCFKCLILALEVMCSIAWDPEVQSKKF